MVQIGNSGRRTGQYVLPVVSLSTLLKVIGCWFIILVFGCGVVIYNQSMANFKHHLRHTQHHQAMEGKSEQEIRLQHHLDENKKVKGHERDGNLKFHRPSSEKHSASQKNNHHDNEGKLIRVVIGNLDGVEGHSEEILVRTRPWWAPIGEQRFIDLVESGFYSECRFFRVVPNFVVQIGINGDPNIQGRWRGKSLVDDPVKHTNARGTISFATSGKNTRSTQIFINTSMKGNAFLDKQGFAPFAEVVEGMEIVDRINAQYRQEPGQAMIQKEGNAYLLSKFPTLSYIEEMKIISS